MSIFESTKKIIRKVTDDGTATGTLYTSSVLFSQGAVELMKVKETDKIFIGFNENNAAEIHVNPTEPAAKLKNNRISYSGIKHTILKEIVGETAFKIEKTAADNVFNIVKQ